MTCLTRSVCKTRIFHMCMFYLEGNMECIYSPVCNDILGSKEPTLIYYELQIMNRWSKYTSICSTNSPTSNTYHLSVRQSAW
jgi:hypothetical protein